MWGAGDESEIRENPGKTGDLAGLLLGVISKGVHTGVYMIFYILIFNKLAQISKPVFTLS